MNKTNKIVVFEEINSGFIPVINKFLNEGYIVYFIGIEDRIRKQNKIQRCLEANRVVDLSKMIFNHLLYSQAAFYAHENLDQIFNKYFSNTMLIRITSNLLESPEIENMYKKEVLNILQRIYESELRINEIGKNNPNEIYFYPIKNSKIYMDESSLLLKNIRIIYYKNIKIEIKQILRKLRDVFVLFFPIYLFLKKTRSFSLKEKPRKKYKIGLQLHLPSLFTYNYNYINFIIDDIYKIPKSELLLIDESGEPSLPNSFLDTIFSLKRLQKKSPYMDISKKLGYDYTNITKTKGIISVNFFWNKFIKSFFPAWIKCFLYSFSDKKVNIDITRLILTDYIKWNIFVAGYTIHNHITVLLPDNISKNLIFSSNKIRTLFIYPDNYAADYHSGWDEKYPTSLVFAFINSEFAVVYGEKIRRYLNYNRNNIKNYAIVGVLPSQRVRELQEGKLTSKLVPIFEKKNLPRKIIAVFDTTFADFGVLKIKDGIRFGNDILRLLDEIPEIGVIFKEKKPISYYPTIAPVYEKLENHERCLFVRKTEIETVFSTEVIALSDLVISAAYTSTNAEALGAKVKAIYYDVAGTDIGDHYYFNKFPNFVAHNYEELKRLVNYWLYEITDKEFVSFLNTYVKGEIDPYLDGKAIDRLQDLLLKD